MLIKAVVIDTNVFISALKSERGSVRSLLRACLYKRCLPLIGNALLMEMEDIISREYLWNNSSVTMTERHKFLDAFVSVCKWVPIYYLWRPNLVDKADNHVYDVAIAGNADAIITYNKKHFQNSQLLFPNIEILKPVESILTFKEH
jgi:uncharacterized protein